MDLHVQPPAEDSPTGPPRGVCHLLERNPDWQRSPLSLEVRDLAGRIRHAPSIAQVLKDEAKVSAHHQLLVAALHLFEAFVDSSPSDAFPLLLCARQSGAEVPASLFGAAFELASLPTQALWVARELGTVLPKEYRSDAGPRFERCVEAPSAGYRGLFSDPGTRVQQLVSHAFEFRSLQRHRLPSGEQPSSIITVSFTYDREADGKGLFTFAAPSEDPSIGERLPALVQEFIEFLSRDWANTRTEGVLQRSFNPLDRESLVAWNALAWVASREEEAALSLTLKKREQVLRLEDCGWGGVSKALGGTPPSQLSDKEMTEVLTFIVEGAGEALSPDQMGLLKAAAFGFAEQRNIFAIISAPSTLVAKLRGY